MWLDLLLALPVKLELTPAQLDLRFAIPAQPESTLEPQANPLVQIAKLESSAATLEHLYVSIVQQDCMSIQLEASRVWIVQLEVTVAAQVPQFAISVLQDSTPVHRHLKYVPAVDLELTPALKEHQCVRTVQREPLRTHRDLLVASTVNLDLQVLPELRLAPRVQLVNMQVLQEDHVLPVQLESSVVLQVLLLALCVLQDIIQIARARLPVRSVKSRLSVL
jgi:hypothetical protein